MILRKIILSKKTVMMSLMFVFLLSFIFSKNAYSIVAEKAGCDYITVKVFGISILRKYNKDCSMGSLPDGKWDWFPEQE